MLEDGWILRNDIVWNKPNPMPESVKDRFTTSWEHLFFFSKSRRYFFEQQFEHGVTDASDKAGHRFGGNKNSEANSLTCHSNRPGEKWEWTASRNKRDAWEINTQPYPEAHFATYPEKLCETPVLAGCPSMICKKCGKAREKVYEKTGHVNKREPAHQPGNTPTKVDSTGWAPTERPTTKYTDCACNIGFEPGTVLDPFCGSGTTLAVAKKRGRKAIGIDINENYCKLTVKRLQEIPLSMELG
jgi:DNA modification methylase